MQAVFRPDGLWRLVRRQRGRSKCRLAYQYDDSGWIWHLRFSTVAASQLIIETMPTARAEKLPVFLPTRELLSIYPGFVSLYETTELQFPETWRDTCILLGAPLARGPREGRIKELLEPLETAMGGSVDLDRSGRFYLNLSVWQYGDASRRRGLAQIGYDRAPCRYRLAAGQRLSLLDEPDANLNPKFIKTVAQTILQTAQSVSRSYCYSQPLSHEELQILVSVTSATLTCAALDYT